MAIYCAKCEAPKSAVADTCTSCGSVLSSIRLPVEGLSMTVTAGNVGFVLDQHPNGRREIRVHTPAGGTSSSSASSDGVSHTVRGHEMGKKGSEARTIRDLLQALRAGGHDVEKIAIPKERDDWGEDALFRINSLEYVIQVVTVPRDAYHWRAAIKQSSKLQHTIDEAVDALRDAIAHKCERTPPGERKRTILALDAGHAGALVEYLDAYLARHGDPVREYGVASVWFVGPSEMIVVRVGTGTP